MSSYKTEAIVLSRTNLGESDRILTLFSPEFGIIRAVAKGARKTKSKFSGHVELFCKNNFIITTGRNLDIVNEASLLKCFLNNEMDLETVKTAYYLSEIITRLLPDKEPHIEIYNSFDFCLSNIKDLGNDLTRLIFVAKTLKIMGIYPELEECIICRSKPAEESKIFFSKVAGGMIDEKCCQNFADGKQTKPEVVKFWRFVASSSFAKLLKLNISHELIKETLEIANDYIRSTTMIDYRSLRVLS